MVFRSVSKLSEAFQEVSRGFTDFHGTFRKKGISRCYKGQRGFRDFQENFRHFLEWIQGVSGSVRKVTGNNGGLHRVFRSALEGFRGILAFQEISGYYNGFFWGVSEGFTDFQKIFRVVSIWASMRFKAFQDILRRFRMGFQRSYRE